MEGIEFPVPFWGGPVIAAYCLRFVLLFPGDGYLLWKGRYCALVPFVSCTDLLHWRATISYILLVWLTDRPNYYCSRCRFQHAARFTFKWLVILCLR